MFSPKRRKDYFFSFLNIVFFITSVTSYYVHTFFFSDKLFMEIANMLYVYVRMKENVPRQVQGLKQYFPVSLCFLC